MDDLNLGDDFAPTADDWQDVARSVRVAQNIQVAKGFDGNADQAAHAAKVSEVVGAPPEMVNNNYEEFIKREKTWAAQNIVGDNDALRDYVMSHPLASTVSQDDWAALDEFTRQSSGPAFKNMFAGWTNPVKDIGNEALDKATEAWTQGGITDDTGAIRRAMDPSQNQAGFMGALAAKLVYGFIDVAERSFAAGGGLVGGAIAGAGKAVGLEEAESQRVAEAVMNMGMAESGLHMHPTEPAPYKPKTGAEAARPFFEAGQEPPTGLHPEIDSAKAQMNAKFVEQLDNDLALAMKTETREKSPELFKKIAEGKYGDTSMGIKSDTVLKMYPEGKVPEPDDGLLGWVPNIAEQLDALRDTPNADLMVPMADWITHVDPTVKDTLKDDLRVWPGGVTANEAKELPTEPRDVIGEPLPSIRAGAGLEPKFSIGDRKLTLMRQGADARPEDPEFVQFGEHVFDILDENGQRVGDLQITPGKDGKTLLVDWIGGTAGQWANTYGPALVRDIKKQLKAAYPDYEYLTGYRVSGARLGAGSQEAMPMPRVKLEATGDLADDYQKTQNILVDGWRKFGETEFQAKPAEGWTPEQTQAFQDLKSHIDLVTGGRAQVLPTAGLRQAEGGTPLGGIMQPMVDRKPVILINMLADDPLGTGYHEAGHVLREYGLINDKEWATLSQAAKDEGWLDRYRINERYGHLDDEGKLEEAIVDGLKEYATTGLEARGKGPVAQIFQKLLDYFEQLKRSLGFAPDLSWSEIFEKVQSGEMGERQAQAPRTEGVHDLRPKAAADEGWHWDPTVGNERSVDVARMGSKRGQPEMNIANPDLSKQLNPDYRSALVQQTIDKYLTAETDVRPTSEWEKAGPTTNGVINAKRASEGGKTAMAIHEDGRRVFFRDGERIARDGLPDMPRPKASIEDERKAVLEGMTNLQAQQMGLPADAFAKLQEGLRKQGDEDLKIATARAEKEAAKRTSEEWKTNAVEMRKEVAKDLRQRPDIAADLFLGSGEMHGQKMRQRFTLASDALTPEQKAGLPAHYVSKNGLRPDDIAGLFGYSSGEEMVEAVSKLNALKVDADGKPMQSSMFLNKMTQVETERRMELRYGDSAAQALDDARDRALSETQGNVLHQELQAAAMQAGVTVPDRAAMRARAAEIAKGLPIGNVSSQAQLNQMGRLASKAQEAILKGDYKTATPLMQQQTLMQMVAGEVAKREQEIAKFNKVADRWAKREQTVTPPEYTNWIHDILKRAGKTVRRTEGDIKRQVGMETEGTLEQFVKGRADDLSALQVSDFLLNPNWKAPDGKFMALTGEQFDGVAASVKTLIDTGKRDMQVITKNEAMEKAAVVEELTGALKKDFDFKDIEAQQRSSIVTRLPKGFLIRATQVENLLNRWDRMQFMGPWFKYMFRDLVDGANQADAWKKEYSKRLVDAHDGADLRTAIDNKLFRAPDEYGGNFVQMNRASVRKLILDWGSESGRDKVTKGWGVSRDQVQAFLEQHAKPEDFKFAEKVWKLFDDMKEQSDIMYRSLGRQAPTKISASPVEMSHGTYSGGYFPVKYHDAYAKVPKLESKGIMQEGYEAIEPPAGHTIARQNFYQPLAMDLDWLPGRINQVIHDTAMRPSVENFVKLLYDPKLQATIKTRAGTETFRMLEDYIKGVANRANTGLPGWKDGWVLGNYLRENMQTALVGFNVLGTAVKHFSTSFVTSAYEVGPGKFVTQFGRTWPDAFGRAVRGLLTTSPEATESNYQFAMKNSQELQRRDRNYLETITGAVGSLTGTSGKFMGFRQRMMELASTPLAWSDKLTSVPTWLAAYEEASKQDLSHGDSVAFADRAVRRAHGSSAMTTRPVIMNQLGGWLTSFYNFFNDILNRQMQTVWRAGMMMDLAKEGKWPEAATQLKLVAGGVLAYSLWPAIVEEWSSPQPAKKDDSELKRAAKAIAYTEGATLPVVREIVNAMLHEKDPDVGLITPAGGALVNMWRDINKNQPFSPAHAQTLIKHAGALAGLLGAVPEAATKPLAFGYGVSHGLEHPRGPWGWLVGARYGTLKGHSATLSDRIQGR